MDARAKEGAQSTSQRSAQYAVNHLKSSPQKLKDGITAPVLVDRKIRKLFQSSVALVQWLHVKDAGSHFGGNSQPLERRTIAVLSA